MSKTYRNQIENLYSNKTEEELRAIHSHALKIGTATAAKHAAVIEEILDQVM